MVSNPVNLSFGLLVWIFLFRMSLAFAGSVIVESNIDQNSGQVNLPLSGTITITHDQESTIDPKTFQLEGKFLDASFVKNVNLAGDTRISIYKFTLPPQEKGMHILPPISVKIGHKIYQSLPTSYEVGEAAIPSITLPSSKSSAPPILRLEAFVQGPTTLYLGERTALVYRISFNRSVDLTKSELPMIHTTAFLKIGDAQVRDVQQGDMTIQEISQLIEASQMGHFKLGPSLIEGYAYRINELGRKEYESQLLHAEAAAIDLIVNAFSLADQPASFNGAIGVVKPEIAMTSPAQIEVGDTIALLISLAGITNSADLQLPPLSCQPGFSGLFQVNDLPPAAEMQRGIKKFHVELRPLSSLVTEIPSIEVSSYDLKTKKYHVAKTNPIPLTVLQVAPKQEAAIIILPEQLFPTDATLKAMLSHPVPPVEIRGTEVNLDHMQIPLLQRGWILFVLPIGLLILILQVKGHQIALNRTRPKIFESELLLNQAQKMVEKPDKGIKLVEKAMWNGLIERDVIEDDHEGVACLSVEGKAGQVRSFLLRLQSLQYGPEKSYQLIQLVQEARQLLRTL